MIIIFINSIIYCLGMRICFLSHKFLLQINLIRLTPIYRFYTTCLYRLSYIKVSYQDNIYCTTSKNSCISSTLKYFQMNNSSIKRYREFINEDDFKITTKKIRKETNKKLSSTFSEEKLINPNETIMESIEKNDEIIKSMEKSDASFISQRILDTEMVEDNTADHSNFDLDTTLQNPFFNSIDDLFTPKYLKKHYEDKYAEFKFKNKLEHKGKITFSNVCKGPNYFVGIQISNPEIHRKVVEVQKSLLKNNSQIGQALIDIATLHITILVIQVETDDQLYVACSALDNCGALLENELSSLPLSLTFDGLSHFSHQTLFVKLFEDEQYKRLVSIANKVKTIFYDFNVTITDKKAFEPHLTIAKLSKMPRGKSKLKTQSIKKIDPTSYSEFSNYKFGTQVIQSLQLLSMTKPKDVNRYYFNSREVIFDVNHSESMDHSMCCFPRQPLIDLKRSFLTSSAIKDQILSVNSDLILKTVIAGAAVVSVGFILAKLVQR